MNINQVMSKLNIIEQNIIRKHIQEQNLKYLGSLKEAAAEREEVITATNNKTWDIISNYLVMALRENHISKERIEKINSRIKEMSDATDEKLYIDLNLVHKFEILEKSEYEDLIEEIIQTHCKGCSKKAKDCSLHKKLEQHKVSEPTGYKGKCKYYFV